MFILDAQLIALKSLRLKTNETLSLGFKIIK
jgi:hypothetical protein